MEVWLLPLKLKGVEFLLIFSVIQIFSLFSADVVSNDGFFFYMKCTRS